MPYSLKKQIFQNKVKNFITTRPIILFFAIFDLPPKTREKLNSKIYDFYNKKSTKYNSLVKGGLKTFTEVTLDDDMIYTNQQCLSSNKPLFQKILSTKEKKCNVFSSEFKELGSCPLGSPLAQRAKEAAPLGQIGPLKGDAPKGQVAPVRASPSGHSPVNQKQRPLGKNKDFAPEILHVNNKCFNSFYKSNILPLYGQTLMVALRNDEDLRFLPQFSSLYGGILLGGFYKNVPQSKKYYLALANKTEKKLEVYSDCLNVLAESYKNYHNTCNAVLMQFLRLSNYLSKPTKPL